MSVSTSGTKRVFVFKGTLLIPGSPTREKADFGPVKVAASTLQLASADLQPVLTETFRKEVPHKFGFSRDFAMYHIGHVELPPLPQKVKGQKSKVNCPVVEANDNSAPPDMPVSAVAE